MDYKLLFFASVLFFIGAILIGNDRKRNTKKQKPMPSRHEESKIAQIEAIKEATRGLIALQNIEPDIHTAFIVFCTHPVQPQNDEDGFVSFGGDVASLMAGITNSIATYPQIAAILLLSVTRYIEITGPQGAETVNMWITEVMRILYSKHDTQSPTEESRQYAEDLLKTLFNKKQNDEDQ